MKSASSKLIVIIIGTILLPIIIYALNEISSVTEGEEVIEKAYREQLDAVLFSVNQFSNDNLSSILDKIENELNDSLEFPSNNPILDFSNFRAIFFKDLKNGHFNEKLIFKYPMKPYHWENLQDSLIQSNPNLLEQLERYKTGGYRKIEPRGIFKLGQENCQVIHAILDHKGHNILFTGLLSIDGFANHALAPKLQQIAENQLIISMSYAGTNDFVYLTDSLSKEIIFKKSMWVFPELEVGVTSKSKTVKELVRERMYYNLGAALILIILLIFGFTLVVRNFRQEINLIQTKSDFVSNVSHELRTPLSLISMFAETLYMDRVSSQAKRKEYEEIILKETRRLTNIVNKILNFSQIENNKRIYHLSAINLNDIVSELVHDYGYHIEQNGFELGISLDKNLPDTNLDREAIYEALVNLLDNAMKYSDVHKFVRFSTGIRNKHIYVEVEDHGIGIPSDRIKQIFDKFYRITEGNLQNTRGAGLGLALVNHIVDAHHGSIEVESTPGEGSTFRLIFQIN